MNRNKKLNMGQSASSFEASGSGPGTPTTKNVFSNEYDYLHEQIRRHSATLRQLTQISYEDLSGKIQELNEMSNHYMDCNGKQLKFEIKPGSDSHVLWKGTVRVKCIKIDPLADGKIEKVRELSLKQFLQVYSTMQMHLKASPSMMGSASESCQKVEDGGASTSRSNVGNESHGVTALMNFDMDASVLLDQATRLPGGTEECCICMERKPEVSLPCAHVYCLACIEQWNVNHKTCPICRDKLENTDDTWVLEELPNAEDVETEIQKSLFGLTR